MAVSRILPAVILSVLMTVLAGCAGPDRRDPGQMPAPRHRPVAHPPIATDLPALPAAGSGRGAYYKDDGPGDAPPANLRDIPDAEVRAEPPSRYANRPYVVFGKSYVPLQGDQPLVQRGVASWYGKKFHGQRTSSGEIYDMYKMTAAHPTLPIPSYARITHAKSGKQVVVRINDRGPFHASRIVDLSYAAALRLDLLSSGSHAVQLERLFPDGRQATVRRNAPEEQARPAALQPAADVAGLLLENGAEIKAGKAHPEEREPADPVIGAAAPAGGFYVQMGAFSRAGKAAEIRERVAGAGWAGAALDVVRSGALHRVLGGPFASRELAQQALRGLPAGLGFNPIVVRR